MAKKSFVCKKGKMCATKVLSVFFALTLMVSLTPTLQTRAYAASDTFSVVGIEAIPPVSFNTNIGGNESITMNGRYTLKEDATGTITIGENLIVTIAGQGAEKQYKDLNIVVGNNSSLTLVDVFVTLSDGAKPAVDFQGEGELQIMGVNQIDRPTEGTDEGCAVIHVGPSANVTFAGTGKLYGYKHAKGSYIGSNTKEANGKMTFNSGSWFLKGSKWTPAIGGDSQTEKGGDIVINGGEFYVKGISSAALIGGSNEGKSGDIYVNGGLVELYEDFSGPAIGAGEIKNAGKLVVNGGSLKTVLSVNAANRLGYAANIDGIPEVSWKAVKATNADDYALLSFDASKYLANKESDTVSVYVDGEKNPFYSGRVYTFVTNEVKNPTTGENNASEIMANWLTNNEKWLVTKDDYGKESYPSKNGSSMVPEKNLYFALSKTDHTLTVGDDTYQYMWNNDKDEFELVSYYAISKENSEHGSFTVTVEGTEVSEALEGTTVTINTSPDMGYYVDAVTCTTDDGSPVSVERVDSIIPANESPSMNGSPSMNESPSMNGSPSMNESPSVVEPFDGVYAFKMPAKPVKVSVVFREKLQEDDYAWYNKSPYMINSSAELAAFATIVNGTTPAKFGIVQDSFQGKTVTLGSDINLTSYIDWTPIGGFNKPFAGFFDGANKSITGLSITSGTGGYKGLFGNNAGTVKNFSLSGSIGTESANITSGSKNIGGAVGFNNGKVCGVIGNVSVFVKSSSVSVVGGIVGQNGKDGLVTQSLNKANLIVSKISGGVVGCNFGRVAECVNTGNVSGNQGQKDSIGGIVGMGGNKEKTYANSIISCYNTGTISNENGRWFGGIVGYADPATTVIYCYNAGEITPGYSVQWNPICGHVDSVYHSWHDNYSLAGLCAGDTYEITKPLTTGKVLSVEAMKSSTFVLALNGADSIFNKDDNYATNKGFPVLAWQGGFSPGATYAITKATTEHGSFTVSVDSFAISKAFEGSKVTVNVSPDLDYAVDKVAYLIGNDSPALNNSPAMNDSPTMNVSPSLNESPVLIEPLDGIYAFTMPAKPIKVIVTFKEKLDNPINVSVNSSVSRPFATTPQVIEPMLTLSDAEGEVRYEISDGNSSGYFSIDSSTGYITVKASTPVGSYPLKLTASAAGSANYKAGSVTKDATVEITKLPNTIQGTISNPVALTFAKNVQTIDNCPLTVNDYEGAVSYTISGGNSGNYFLIDSSTGKITVKASTPAGSYQLKLTASAAGNNNYQPGSVTKDVTIQIAKTANTIQIAAGYDVSLSYATITQIFSCPLIVRNAVGTVSYTISGGNSGNYFLIDSLTGKITVKASTPAGSYQLKLTASAAGNPNYKAGSVTKDVKVTIAKAASTVSLQDLTVAYNGKPANMAAALVNGSKGKVTYQYYTDTACTKPAKTYVNAGTYFVKATVEADNNYASATSSPVKLVINKAKNKLAVKAVKATQKVKRNKILIIKSNKAFKVKTNTSKGKVTYKLVSVPKKAKGKITVAKNGTVKIKNLSKGTYTVKVKATSATTTNYNKANARVSFKVKVTK